ncbi:MAG: ABC transporter permease subunit, partial [Burkholderiales bacterium]
MPRPSASSRCRTGRRSRWRSSPRFRHVRGTPCVGAACGGEFARGVPIQLAVNIAVLAAIYALISCGYVLIYRVSRVLSLAHGELMMLGAYGLFATASLFSGHPLAAIGA